jgi:hypothetical protein
MKQAEFKFSLILILRMDNTLLTPWCRILFEKLTVTQLAKKNILLSYGNRRFITVFTKAAIGPYPEPAESSFSFAYQE